MDKTTMVSFDVVRGSELLAALDQAHVKVNVAIWIFLTEYEDWRLVFSGKMLDSPDPRDAYGMIHQAFANSGFTVRNIPPILVLPTTDPFIKQLRRIFGKAREVEGMRIGNQLIGGRFVEDGYVYRIT